MHHTIYIVNFIEFTKAIYENYLPLMPIIVSIAIYNAKGMRLVLSSHGSDPEERVTWEEDHLELGEFYVDNLAAEAQILPKKLCDRLWQAFNLDGANVFDDKGDLKRG